MYGDAIHINYSNVKKTISFLQQVLKFIVFIMLCLRILAFLLPSWFDKDRGCDN